MNWKQRVCRECGIVLNDRFADAHVASHFGGETVHAVTFTYNEHLSHTFVVYGAPNKYAAENAALLRNGYDPGVDRVAYLCTNFRPVVLPEDIIHWKPLDAEATERLHGIRMSRD